MHSIQTRIVRRSMRHCRRARRTRVSWSLVALALAACSGGGSDAASESSVAPGLDGPIFDDEAPPDTTPGYFEGRTCASQTAGAEQAPSVLQLLVDTSGSMDQDAPGARGSKWAVTRRAVLGAVTDMPEESAVGLIFYPNVPNNQRPCFDRQTAVGIAELSATNSAQRRQIQQAFQRQRPNGGTPTHDAYQYALQEVAAAASIGPRFVVLITDGIPTYSLGCEGTGQAQDAVDPGPLVVEAAAALTRGIRTFVIGSPGSEGARESLSRMAEAGGTSRDQCAHQGPRYCHFDMTTESDLGASLESTLGIISGVALGCRYAIPPSAAGSAIDTGKVNVLFTPPGGNEELIYQSAEQACSEGWQYAEGGSQIRLCSSTCDRVRELEGSLTLQFGCATELR